MIKEIVSFVKVFVISDQLKASSTEIFLNLVTLEDSAFTIKLNERGFEVVGKSLDTNNTEGCVNFSSINILCPVVKVEIEQQLKTCFVDQGPGV